MKKKKFQRMLAFILGCILAIAPCLAGGELWFPLVSYAEERTASITASNLNVRSGAGTGHPAVAKLSQGSPVTVIGETTGSDGKTWYQIRFSGTGGKETTGYVLGQYVKFPTVITSSAEFESYLTSQGFPESYKSGLRELHEKYPKWTFTAFQTGLDWNTAVENESVIGRNLVARDNISSWKSTAAGAYDWDTGIWPGFDGNSWVQASEDIIRYYMDPRNFLNEKYIYQFMKQSYDGSIHTREGLESMVKGTFLAGSVLTSGALSSGSSPTDSPSSGTLSSGSSIGPGMSSASIRVHETDRVMTAYGPGMDSAPTSAETSSGTVIISPEVSGETVAGSENSPVSEETSGNSSHTQTVSTSYVDILMNAAVESGVNPYILASMILQEQGSQGTGKSISGTVSGYQGYYNYFNIEAYQSGSMSAVQRGLWWASQSGSYQRPWNSIERSILGGAVYYGQNYVKKGQDTLYLKKFNVQGSNLYKHQYMTNVLAAAAEGLTLAKIDALKTTALEFSIPVYNNMPSSACVKPTLDGSPNNKLSGLGVEGFALTPTFQRDIESYDLIVDPSVSSVKVVANAIDSKAKVTGTGTIDLQSGVNQVTVTVTAENGTIRNYVLNVVRQSNGPVYSDAIGTGGITGGSSSGSSSSGLGSSSSGSGTISSGNTIGPGASSGSGSSSSGSGSSSSSSGSSPSGSGSSSSGSGSGPSGSGNSPIDSETSSGTVIISPSGSGSSSSGSGSSPIDSETSSGTVIISPSGSGSSSSSSGSSSSGSGSGPSGSGSPSLLANPSSPEGGSSSSPSGSLFASSTGDVNGDGKINVLDILKIQRHILGLETLTGNAATAADLNGNNKIEVLDVLLLQKQILGIQ